MTKNIKDFFEKKDGRLKFKVSKISQQQLKMYPNLKELVSFINERGFSMIKINSNTLIELYKIKEMSNAKEFAKFMKKIKNDVEMMGIFNLFTNPFGVFILPVNGIISIYFPKFLLEKDNLEENINKFFEIILKNKNLQKNKSSIKESKLIVSKFFLRINRDGKGKVIFSNMVDSITKLGISFLLPQMLKQSKIDGKNLLKNIDYLLNFVVFNTSNVVTENCRENPLSRKLLENIHHCKPKKLVSECPKQKSCPEQKPCPTPTCPQPSCPEAICPEISCPETSCPECPACPKTVCPSPNFVVPVSIISGVILLGVVIILLTRKSGKK